MPVIELAEVHRLYKFRPDKTKTFIKDEYDVLISNKKGMRDGGIVFAFDGNMVVGDVEENIELLHLWETTNRSLLNSGHIVGKELE